MRSSKPACAGSSSRSRILTCASRARGIRRLRAAGVDVEVGPGAAAGDPRLTPYLFHRRTGRPYVVAKLGTSLDGKIAAADGTSQWITSAEAHADAPRVAGRQPGHRDRIRHRARGSTCAHRARGHARAAGRAAARAARRTRSCPRRRSSLRPLPRADPRDHDRTGTRGRRRRVERGGCEGGDGRSRRAEGCRSRRSDRVAGTRGGRAGARRRGRRARRRARSKAATPSVSSRTSHRWCSANAAEPGYAFPGPDTLATAPRFTLVDVTQFGSDLRATYEAA